MKLGIGAIIENNKGDILVVEEKETREDYSKFAGDISIPFGKVGDNHKGESFVDALYREVLEETGLNLNENKYLPCDLGFGYFLNIKGEIIFKAQLFNIKLNGVLKKYEEKILNDEVENAYFISKEDFEEKIKKGGIRAGAEVFYERYKNFLEIENTKHWNPVLKRFMMSEKYNKKDIAIVGPGSKYNLKHEGK